LQGLERAEGVKGGREWRGGALKAEVELLQPKIANKMKKSLTLTNSINAQRDMMYNNNKKSLASVVRLCLKDCRFPRKADAVS